MPRPVIDSHTEGLRALARLVAGAIADSHMIHIDPIGSPCTDRPSSPPRLRRERAQPPDP